MGVTYHKSSGKAKYIKPGVYVLEREITVSYSNPVIDGYIKINGKIQKALDVVDFDLTEEEVKRHIKNELRRKKLKRIFGIKKN